MSKYKVGDQIYVKCRVVGISDEDDPVIELTDWGNRVAVAGEEICTKTYEDGLADAWEALQKSGRELMEIFGGLNIAGIMANNTPQEAIAKIKEYEASKEIRRGDEVVINGEYKGVVTNIAYGFCEVMWGEGSCGGFMPDALFKTGRNFVDKLDALLSEIGGENDGQD